MHEEVEGKKRSKTFTGCFTCRSRKIRCDLTRPRCLKCDKAGLNCSGYDIKLRWSEPIQFKKNKDNITSNNVTFQKKGKLSSDEGEEAEYFQRRAIDFVRWKDQADFSPYTTYDQIDKHLNELQNTNDSQVIQEDKTKTLGPFGVFKNRISKKRPMQKLLSDKSSKRPKLDSTLVLESEPPPEKRTPTKKDFTSITSTEDITTHDQLWLSNELRDDALLTAAALNGDTHFLDFINNFSSRSDVDPGGGQRTSKNPPGQVDHNRNDFLNLVFHRQNNFGDTAGENNGMKHGNDEMSSAASNHSEGGVSPFLLTDVSNNVSIDPSNQHLYYSNFNNYYYNNPYKSNKNLEIQLHASKISNRAGEMNTDIVGGATTEMPTDVMCIVQNPLQPKIGFDITIPNSSIGLPNTALQVQPLTRYLLNYYNTHVADLMTVIPLTENPWKTVYFPRALMAIGELSALGKTSNAKNALLNALLAVSAFNLQSKFSKNSEPMKYYLNLGIRLRNQASLFVKNLLGSKHNSGSGIENCVMNEKYKDVLCAIMSMISVDLVWGTMQDTNFYIKWCGKVIEAKMANKKKLSSRARILHRIFSSLKLIQDSTCLDLESIKDDFELKDGNPSEMAKRLDKFVNNFPPSDGGQPSTKAASPTFVNKKLINTKKDDEHFATDALYGLPNSLITLFKETVQILRSKIYFRETNQTLSDHFDASVDDLETRLLAWKLDWKFSDSKSDDSAHPSLAPDPTKISFISPMHEATYHHIMSFYHALCIYFKRLIKGAQPADLQDKVASTLEHLNAIQKLISRDEASIIPLFWQGFIAGCEATSSELQMGFKKWGADIAQYLGSYWGARQIMLEVWRRKQMREPRDDWVSVIGDWEMNLMLN
ncbi:Piso0_002222 [Millerozyma farinosa CBS 7064]|uniref:Piso0_002222 protein n=1 Tax=Pichia sorbitophila (strain ATCC MYA-4447 / BCRC 22081 / CBS 7064 / NBRC 10061 / NRRL Y-12695) TaxID=559304 RepID=G8YC14_PICSO|nr:Piso0_002222 [Millerozyma farinosa CBS 7064]